MSIAGGLALAPLAFILGLLGLTLHLRSTGLSVVKSPPFIMLMLFLLWACLTSIWSPYRPDDLLTNYIKLFIMGSVFYFAPFVFKRLSQQDAVQVTRVFLVTIFLGALIVTIDIVTNFKITFFVDPPKSPKELGQSLGDAEQNLSHAITVLVMLFAPVTILLKSQIRRWKSLSACFFMLVVIASMFNDLWVGILGSVLVVVTMVLSFKFYRHVPFVILTFAVLAILFAPLLALISTQLVEADFSAIPVSWEHRIRMWSYCWPVISENPIIGDGFDAARTYTAQWTTRHGVDWPIVSLHPHNAGLQIWTETGLIGALLATSFVSTLITPVKAFATSPERSAILSGVLIAGLLMSSITTGAWQSWWWGCIFLTVGVVFLTPVAQTVEK